MCILKQTSDESFSWFLKSQNGLRLEPQVWINVCGDLSDKSLERCVRKQKLSGSLVLSHFTKSYHSRSEAWLLRDNLLSSLSISCCWRWSFSLNKLRNTRNWIIEARPGVLSLLNLFSGSNLLTRHFKKYNKIKITKIFNQIRYKSNLNLS